MNVSMEFDSPAFTHKFSRPFASTLLLALPLGMLLVLAKVGVRAAISRAGRVSTLAAIIAGLAGAALFTVAWTKLLTVRLGPSGIRCYNFFGLYRSLAWGDVGRADLKRFARLPYIRVWPRTGGLPLWVPLYLNDMQGFRQLVLRHAGPSNPLSKCLSDGGA
jgi:hypothetical protein